jgi:hypothetical protein
MRACCLLEKADHSYSDFTVAFHSSKFEITLLLCAAVDAANSSILVPLSDQHPHVLLHPDAVIVR